MALVADVRAISLDGSFTALTDAQIQTYLDLAAEQLDSNAWGGCYDNAHRLLAAHLITMAQASSASGPVQSASAGGLSVSYGSLMSQDPMFVSRYGAMFRRLSLTCGLWGGFCVEGASLIEG